MKCAVLNCHTGYKVKASERSSFSFPVRQSKKYDFKTAYICMKHFADFENLVKFELGFGKKRILKREDVSSLYKPSDAKPERSQRAQRRQNKEIVGELPRQSKASVSHAGEV